MKRGRVLNLRRVPEFREFDQFRSRYEFGSTRF
jgi:hypothetical protein